MPGTNLQETIVQGNGNCSLSVSSNAKKNYANRFPNRGETIHGSSFKNEFGGKGANQVVAAAKLGANTALIAKVGDDPWGKLYLEHLKKEHVGTDYVEIITSESTGIAQITVEDKTGDNTIVIVAGANAKLSSNDVKLAERFFANSKILLCQLECSLDATLEALKSFKGISILNAAPALKNMSSDLMKIPSILCVNETEAKLLTNKNVSKRIDVSKISGAVNALQELVKIGANTVIITLGEDGAIYSEKNDRQIIHVPVKKVKSIDTTGAGDCFLGSLAFLLSKHFNEEFHQIVGCACEIASISVQRLGTQSSFPTFDDVIIDFSKNKYQYFKIIT